MLIYNFLFFMLVNPRYSKWQHFWFLPFLSYYENLICHTYVQRMTLSRVILFDGTKPETINRDEQQVTSNLDTFVTHSD